MATQAVTHGESMHEHSVLRERPPIVAMAMHHTNASKVNNCPRDFIPVRNFDAVFSIFHNKVISNILPYHTEFDEESWWHSQRFVNEKVCKLYLGKVLLYNKTFVYNGQHPRRKTDITEELVASVRNKIRTKFPDRPELAQTNCNLIKQLVHCYCTKGKSKCPKVRTLDWQ